MCCARPQSGHSEFPGMNVLRDSDDFPSVAAAVSIGNSFRRG